MNSNFYGKCIKMLESIKEGTCSFGKASLEVIKGIQVFVQEKMDLADTFYLVGMTPVGEKMLDYFKKNRKTVIIVDKFINEESYKNVSVMGLPGTMKANELAVICSRENLVEYAMQVEDANGEFVFYNQLFLWNREMGIDSSQFHTYTYVAEKIEEIWKNPSAYIEILECLEEKHSKELLAKIILYRVTFDVSLAYGVNSGNMHYFDKDIITLSEKEIFVDVGGFDGDTLRDFMEVSRGNYGKYYLFEPDAELCQKAREVSGDGRICYVQKACYDQAVELWFDSEGFDAQGRIVEKGRKKIEAIRLDDFINDKVTFLKMDAEGSEIKALEGAKGLIGKFHPKLAICIYHKPDDIRRIFGFIRSMGYRNLYVRAGVDTLDYEIIVYALE